MSDETEHEVIPGPLDLNSEEATNIRRKTSADSGDAVEKKPSKRGRPPKKAAEAKKENASDADDGKQLLFSSSDNDFDEDKRSEPDDSEDRGNGKSAQNYNSGEENQPRPKQYPNNKGKNQGQFNKGQFKQPQQQGLSNRKKKQQQWKAKQQQKKVKKDRFKIDGLNAEFDNSLDLGRLPEWEVINSFENLEQYLSEQPKPDTDKVFNFNELYVLPLDQLREAAAATGIEMPSAPNRKQMIETVLKHVYEQNQTIELTGNLEILSDGYGMLAFSSDSYRLRSLSAFVPSFFIKKFGLLRGHEIHCRVIPSVEEASCPLAVEILQVQGMEPEKANEIVPFTEQIPYYPLQRIFLETEKQEAANKVSMRVVDLISPIGFGQRGLIVAPPRTGKTVLLQGMANSIQYNYPDAHLIILLIDERPEEVTDFRRRVIGGEVISSTFDENAESHVHAAEMVIEKSRRMVEAGRDVVILLDSITRLARAYNTVMPNSGKILSGGVEANALQKPKRFFGSARNIEGGGSLTIIATALVETGSKMDEVIFEEFKGTGNMELHLDRALVDKRVFPALSMEKSGTRKEELLYHPDELNKIYGLRRAMKGVPSTEAMEMLITRVKKTGSNAEFLMAAGR